MPKGKKKKKLLAKALKAGAKGTGAYHKKTSKVGATNQALKAYIGTGGGSMGVVKTKRRKKK